jgi:AcrR family transcriptional regulator
MPKRDEAYMEGQRLAIARAALEVLLEKGVYATSQRDICKAAGISIGALYTHFRTKEEAIVAACALDYVDTTKEPPAESWVDYIENIHRSENWGRAGGRRSKRFRLSLQFVAELTQFDHNPEGLSTIYQIYRGAIASSLKHLHEKRIITMPLGLAQTTELHMQLIAGSSYQLAADRDLQIESVNEALAVGLALTAGLVADEAGLAEAG